MSTIRAMVTIPRKNAIAADAVTNTFHFFKVGAPNAGDYTDIAGRLDNFYKNPGSGSALETMLSFAMNGPGSRLKQYDLADPKPRIPHSDTPIVLTNVDSGMLPAEVAVCLSYQAAPESGVPQARKRGRIYFGPITDGRDQVEASVDDRPNTGLTTALREAAVRLIGFNTGTLYWCVYSSLSGPSGPVIGGWTDNAFDTQRRRGAKATVRNTF